MSSAVQRPVSDPLSDVLDMLHLRGEVVGRSELVAPWGISFPEGVARFHLVERGSTWLRATGTARSIEVSAGDLVMLANGAGHALTSVPGASAIPLHFSGALELIQSRRPRRSTSRGRRMPEAALY